MIDSKQVETIKHLIRIGNFADAKKAFKEDDYSTLKQVLFDLACDEQNICSYAFICFLLMENEQPRYHSLASALFEVPFCHMEGASNVGLYHTKRAYEISPNDVGLQERILIFNEIPDKVLNDEEALIIAKEVFSKDPSSIIAREIIEKYGAK